MLVDLEWFCRIRVSDLLLLNNYIMKLIMKKIENNKNFSTCLLCKKKRVDKTKNIIGDLFSKICPICIKSVDFNRITVGDFKYFIYKFECAKKQGISTPYAFQVAYGDISIQEAVEKIKDEKASRQKLKNIQKKIHKDNVKRRFEKMSRYTTLDDDGIKNKDIYFKGKRRSGSFESNK